MPNDTTRSAVLNVNGIDLHHEVRGEGPPLVLLHGFTGSSADFQHLFDLDALAQQFRLVLVDLRGHGASSFGAEPFSHRQCARDVRALLDHLEISRCKAVGVSFGGNTLLHLATSDPGRIEAMVLSGSPSHFPASARAIMAMVSPDEQSPAEWERMRGQHKHGDEQIRALWRQARAFKDSYDDMNFTPPLLGTISARTLLINGDRDPLYPAEIFLEMYRAIPNASLCFLPNAGHAPLFGEYRAFVVATVLAFLQGRAPFAPPAA
jgi:pimeloyl-ACP methyl ester carboxylesterase